MNMHTIENLFVGDIDESLAQYAKSFCNDAQIFLIDTNITSNNLYVSIGDVGVSCFLELALRSKCIYYHNKNSAWSSIQLKESTEYILYLLQLYKIITDIKNFPADQIKLEFNPLYLGDLSRELQTQVQIQKLCVFNSNNNYLGTVAHRKSLTPQLWVAGCSYAVGHGLDIPSQRYGDIVAHHLSLSTTNIGFSGTSIDFSADQLLRSKLQKNDIVLWGLTGLNRYTWFNQKCSEHIRINNIPATDARQERFLTDMLMDDSRLLLAQKTIDQVQNVCNLLGVKLFIIYHANLSIAHQSNHLEEFLKQYDNFIDIDDYMKKNYEQEEFISDNHLDLGNDNVHPGPKTHAAWATIINQAICAKIA